MNELKNRNKGKRR
jgi:hypothetical protein